MANVLGMRGRVGAGRLQIVVRPGVFRVGEWVEQISFEQFSAPSADTNEVARVVRGIAPDVLEVDFDEPGKNFTRANVDNRTAVTALTSDEAAASIENADFSDAVINPTVQKKLCKREDAKGTNAKTGTDTRESLMCIE